MSQLRQIVLRYESKKKDTERWVSNVASFVAVPILIGALTVVSPSMWATERIWLVLLWIILAALALLWFWRADPAGRSLLGLLRDNETLEGEVANRQEDIDGLRQSLNLLVWQSTVSISTRRMVVRYVKDGVGSTSELQECFSELLAPLYLSGEELFGIGASEKWSIGVYLYSKQSDLLVPIWREKARTHPSVGVGRSWMRGEGHVGKAFVNKKAIITSDALHPDVEPLSVTPESKTRDYDPSVYRSFAAHPIGPITDSEAPACGVLVATSDREQRFDRENTTIMAQLADVLASLIELGDIDVDALLKSDSDVEAREKRTVQ